MKANQAWIVGLCAGALLLGISTQSHAADGADRAPTTQSTMEREMQLIEKPYKQLQRYVKDPKKNEKSLALVTEMQIHTILSKAIVPKVPDSVPADQRAKYISDYRAMMANMVREELDLEDALIEGNQAKAVESMKSLHDIEEQGHEDFRPKSERARKEAEKEAQKEVEKKD